MNKQLTRRGFIAITSAAAATSVFGDADERPIWTAGIVTDTHLRPEQPESYQRIDWLAKLFREKKIDVFFHCGDIAERYDPKAYAYIRRVFDREFVPNGIREFFVYHNHDRTGSRKHEDPNVVFADVRKYLKANDLYVSTEICGTPVLLLPYRWENNPRRAEELMVAAERKFPDGPILVFDHMPTPNTVANSGVWGGSGSQRKFYRKHPRAIQISGHTHSSIQSETEIYQDDDVTVVNAGCLTSWTGETVGYNPPRATGYGALIMEVFASRIVFRRFDIRDGSEYHPERPWTLRRDHWKTRDYDQKKLAATMPKAAFAAGAALKLAPAKDADFDLEIPVATMRYPGDGYLYKIEILDGSGRLIARRDVSGLYHLPERNRPTSFVHKLPFSLVRGVPGAKIRVTPVSFHLVDGKPLELQLSAADIAMAATEKIAWTGEGPFERQDDYFVLPPEATSSSKRKRRLRFTLELETVQGNTTGLSLDMCVAGTHRQLNPWMLMAVAPGKPGVLRYVFDVIPDQDAMPFEVRVYRDRGCGVFKVRRVTVS